MSALTRDAVRKLREQLTEHLAGFDLKAAGLESIEVGNASFDPNGAVTFKLQALAAGGLTPEASHYELMRQHSTPPLPPLGGKFHYGACDYQVSGAKARSGKILARSDANGKTYLFPRDVVARLWMGP